MGMNVANPFPHINIFSPDSNKFPEFPGQDFVFPSTFTDMYLPFPLPLLRPVGPAVRNTLSCRACGVLSGGGRGENWVGDWDG